MSMLIGGASVVVVEHKHGGMSCDAFKGKLEAVLQMIDRGDLGGGLSYGCDEHKAALHIVERQIAETRRCIAEQEANDAADGTAPSQAPTPPNGALGTGSAAGHTTAEFSNLSTQAHGYGADLPDGGQKR